MLPKLFRNLIDAYQTGPLEYQWGMAKDKLVFVTMGFILLSTLPNDPNDTRLFLI